MKAKMFFALAMMSLAAGASAQKMSRSIVLSNFDSRNFRISINQQKKQIIFWLFKK